jgi:hypothetical protein
MLVVEKDTVDPKNFLKFKPLTLVPYCSRLIEDTMLEKRHKKVINDYYLRIDKEIGDIIRSRKVDYEIEYFEMELKKSFK